MAALVFMDAPSKTVSKTVQVKIATPRRACAIVVIMSRVQEDHSTMILVAFELSFSQEISMIVGSIDPIEAM
jgi:ABC-type polar amino acid transport system ATPase subunit